MSRGALSVRPAVFAAAVAPSTVSLSYTGTTSLTFTATTDQPLDGTGLWLEIFEVTRSNTIQYLGYCNTGTTCTAGPVIPSTSQANYVATLGSISNAYPPGGLIATSNTVTPPAWTVSLAASGSTLTATTNYDLSYGNWWIEIFDLTAPVFFSISYLGYCHTGTTCTVGVGNSSHRFIATAGSISNSFAPSPLLAVSNTVGAGGTAGPTGAFETAGGGNAAELNCSFTCRGDPFNTSTGEFFENETDLKVAGRGPGLDLTRSYSSQRSPYDGPFGPGWSFTYGMALSEDPASGVVSVHQENGSVVTFTPNGTGGYTKLAHVLAALVHNADGSWTYTRRARQIFGFDPAGQLSTMRDLNGETVTVARGVGTQISTVSDGAGRALTFAYNSEGRIATVTDPAGRVVTYAYDAAGRLSSTTLPGGAVTGYGYDSANLMTTRTDPRGGVITNTYDAAQRIRTQTDPAGGIMTIGYGSGGATTTTSPGGRVVVDQYTNGLLTSVTRGGGTAQAGTWNYTYNPLTFASATVRDPGGHTSTYTSDAAGNRLTDTDANARTSIWTYDALGDVKTSTDRNGRTTTYTYDATGNLLTSVRPLTGTTQTQTSVYARTVTAHPGDVTSVTSPNGGITTLTYDANGNPATRRDPVGGTTTFAFDVLGRPASSTNPRGKITTYAYDTAGYTSSVTDALGRATVFGHDANGNQTTGTDPAGQTTTNTYDGLDRLVRVVEPDGASSVKTYDGDGNQTVHTDPAGQATTYTYDAQDRPVTSKDPANRTTGYAHDATGNLTSMTDPSGRVTTYGYDLVNRRTSVGYADPATPDATFTYTPAGQRASMVDGTGTTTYTYDSLDRLTDQTNGDGQHSGYAYDLSGLLTRLTYPNNKVITRGYDAAGSLTSITDWAGHTTTLTPDANGNTTKTTYGNAVVATSTFDAVDQLSATTATGPGGVSLASMTYTRDGNGRLASATSTGLPGGAETYSYTARNQLSGVNAGAYTYDAAGNPTLLAGVTTQTFGAANQLTGSTTAGATSSYTYDDLGNRAAIAPATEDKTRYTYDKARRLTQVQKGKLYLPLTPARIADTRTGSGKPYAGLPLGPAGTLSVQVTDRGGVPATGVSAVVLNVVEANATASSFLTVFPTGAARPGTSNINAVAGAVANNEVTVSVGTGGQVSIYNAVGTTNIVVEVLGYYSAGGAGMNAITPTRIADTRAGSGQPYAGTPVPANGTLTVQVSGTAGVPAAATTAILQATLVTPAAAGILTAYPAGTPRPGISSLNYKAGATLTKEITAALGASPSGAVTFYNASTSAVNLVLDLTGYINGTGDALTPLTPARIAATGAASGLPNAGQTMAAGGSVTIQASGRGGIPANARSVVVNVTSPANTTGGYLTVYPGGTRPVTASLSRAVSATTFNQVTTKLSSTGTFTIWNSAGTADVIVDVMASYGPLATYTYDGTGTRATRTTTAGVQKFAWDPTGGIPLLLTDGAVSYLYDDAGSPVEQIDAAGVALYYQHDQYGSTRLLTNATGAVAASYTYNAYGVLTARTGNVDTPLRWNGQSQDTDTGLYYLRARYYDPATAQFLTRDPLEALTGSAYGYADNDPTNAADPSGLCPMCVAVVVGAVIGGGADLGAQALGNVANGCGAFDNISWGEVGGATLIGGGLSGAGAWFAAGKAAAGVGAAARAEIATTPAGRQLTAHYLNETGPVRNIPGSVVDEAIDHGRVFRSLIDRTIYFDSKNNITVILSKTTGKIMSARRGSP